MSLLILISMFVLSLIISEFQVCQMQNQIWVSIGRQLMLNTSENKIIRNSDVMHIYFNRGLHVQAVCMIPQL